MFKAVILAGGSGTRLYPCTLYVNKHLFPIYNKPMIYYPISLALLLGIRELIFVINPDDEDVFQKLFNYLKKLGLEVNYVIQKKPKGLAEGLILAEKFISGNPVLFLLGDNILYGHDLIKIMQEAQTELLEKGGACVFGYYVKDPERFGVVEFDDTGKVISIEEKPKHPKSNYAIIGVYFFDGRALEFAKKVTPSRRGELEITSVLEQYLKEGALRVKLLGRGFAWFDAGTHESFLEAGEFVATIERKTGLMIGCLEEIVYRNGWIDREKLLELSEAMKKTEYGKYLSRLASEEAV